MSSNCNDRRYQVVKSTTMSYAVLIPHTSTGRHADKTELTMMQYTFSSRSTGLSFTSYSRGPDPPSPKKEPLGWLSRLSIGLAPFLSLNKQYESTKGQHTQHLHTTGYAKNLYQQISPPHHHTTTVLWPFFRDHTGEPVPEENFGTLWCKGRLTEADTLTIRLGATPSGLISVHLHHPPYFYRPDAIPATQPTASKYWRQLAHSD